MYCTARQLHEDILHVPLTRTPHLPIFSAKSVPALVVTDAAVLLVTMSAIDTNRCLSSSKISYEALSTLYFLSTPVAFTQFRISGPYVMTFDHLGKPISYHVVTCTLCPS